jgi:hypothetical protein
MWKIEGLIRAGGGCGGVCCARGFLVYAYNSGLYVLPSVCREK